jgi:hypothetical protein
MQVMRVCSEGSTGVGKVLSVSAWRSVHVKQVHRETVMNSSVCVLCVRGVHNVIMSTRFCTNESQRRSEGYLGFLPFLGEGHSGHTVGTLGSLTWYSG